VNVLEQQHGAVAVFKPDGPLTGTDAEGLKGRLLGSLEENLGRMVLDASAIAIVDSKGLEMLVEVAHEMARSGQTLKLCGVNETTRQVLELTGLSSQFEYFEDASSAVRSFL